MSQSAGIRTRSRMVCGLQPSASASLSGMQATPAVGHNLGMKDPVGGGMDAMGQFPELALFNGIERRASG
jgi:hypothetical protein